jgi:hypothetical protein
VKETSSQELQQLLLFIKIPIFQRQKKGLKDPRSKSLLQAVLKKFQDAGAVLEPPAFFLFVSFMGLWKGGWEPCFPF